MIVWLSHEINEMLSLPSVWVLSLSAYVAVGAAVPAQQGVRSLSAAQVDAFNPYSNYAAAAYCKPSATLHWTCGRLSSALLLCVA